MRIRGATLIQPSDQRTILQCPAGNITSLEIAGILNRTSNQLKISKDTLRPNRAAEDSHFDRMGIPQVNGDVSRTTVPARFQVDTLESFFGLAGKVCPPFTVPTCQPLEERRARQD
jgi:hypothetical protein